MWPQDGTVTFSMYLAFLGVVVVLLATPGPDTMLAMRYALVTRRSGILAAAGTSSAMFIWAALAALGLAALFESSDIAYYVVSLLGGCYLVWLGLRTTLTARSRFKNAAVITASGMQEASPMQQPQSTSAAKAYFAGVVTCLTNPKVGLFFLALFPQFTPSASGPLFAIGVLGGTVAVVGFAYLGGLALVVDAANRWLSNPRVTAWFELVSGLILLALGAFMVISGAVGFVTTLTTGA